MSSAARGFAAACAAFLVWGLFPLYLHPLSGVPPLQVIAHRIVWSCLFLLAVLAVRGELGRLTSAATRPRVLPGLMLTALLISTNWVTYVWSVAHGHIVDASLGYFVNPLVNVLLGVLVLRERLNGAQWTAVLLAAVAVGYLALQAGHAPWIAAVLAVSFSLYGFLRKTLAVDALPGLTIETLLLAPVAGGYLIWCQLHGSGALHATTPGIDALLLGSGVATAVPLALFAYGARTLPYSTVGILQYLAPTGQLLCGVVVFGESFERERATGFALLWLALAIYALDGLLRTRAAARRATA